MQPPPMPFPPMTREQLDVVGYSAFPGRRDEAMSADGKLAPEWHDLFESIHRHGNSVLTNWRIVAARISRERGMAYRPASVEPGSMEGWSLDPIPWIFSPDEWAKLEKGISQRSRLYEALLADVYGEQRLMKEKVFPAELVLSNKGYLRALRDLTPGNGVVGLGLCAFDIAHDLAGQSFVVNDRFDCPYGLGLALENRTVVNKVLPRLFRRCGVQRIGQFYVDWFENLSACSPAAGKAPVIVILDSSTSGEDSELSFLANYCGIARVHPSDLTVRDGRVWIKTLGGLVAVDAIWKMKPGRMVDSLETEKPERPGVAGLFEAMRAGSVAVASHPGAEVLQSPALYPYLPKICRALFGEELLIPPVATWWCGQKKELSHVLANLSRMVIKPAGHHHEFPTYYASRLSETELSELRAQIEANPAAYVGEEELNISTVPTSRGDELVPRGAVLRTFAFVHREGHAQVMPGGLARVSTADGAFVSTRTSGESKDVWVRSPEQAEPFSIASVVDSSRIKAPEITASRTGENLFWAGRYAERTDTISRFATRALEGQIRGFSLEPDFEAEHEKILLSVLFQLFEVPHNLDAEPDPEKRLGQVLVDRTSIVGITYNLERFHNAAQATWEEWSPASILAIGSCYNGWKTGTENMASSFHLSSVVETLQLNLAAFLGLNLDSMTRDEGWALLDAGRRIERASNICSLLDILLGSGFEEDMETLLNESFLFILDSVRTFQSKFHEIPKTALTWRLLVGEPDYPRSVRNLLGRLEEVLKKLPDPPHQAAPWTLLSPMIQQLDTFLEQFDADLDADIFTVEKASAMVNQLGMFFANLSDEITVSYFSHAKKGQ
ncbi:MAG: hypothetical protein CMO55_03110 [Verrucomicrobiales bacterium]|nr:hypothetical protein [Verrucomicrobiales bacterium]